MRLRLFTQLLSLIAITAGLFLSKAHADDYDRDEQETRISEIYQYFLSQDAKILKPYLQASEIETFRSRSPKLDLSLENYKSTIFVEPNGEFLGSLTDNPIRDTESDGTPYILFRLYQSPTSIHPAQFEAIIFHFIVQSFQREKTGDFHLTRSFYEERKAFWDRYLQSQAGCLLKVLDRNRNVELKTVKLHTGSNLVPLNDTHQLDFTLSNDFQSWNGFAYQKVRLGRRSDSRKQQKVRLSLYDFLLEHFPAYELTVDSQFRFQFSCLPPKVQP